MASITIHEEIARSYSSIIDSSPLLDAKEEMKYAESIVNNKGDKQNAKDMLLKANIRLVIKLASQSNASFIPVNDLIGGGILGLVNAIERFNPKEYKTRLTTYAYSWIKLYINKTIIEHNSGIHIPQNVILKSKKYQELKEGNPDISDKDLMKALDVTKKGLKKIEGCNASMVSLNAPAGRNDEVTTLVEFVADDKAVIADKEIVKNERVALMREALKELDDLPREILTARHLNGQDDTLAVIGKRHGISKQRVAQIEKAALITMKKKISKMTSWEY